MTGGAAENTASNTAENMADSAPAARPAAVPAAKSSPDTVSAPDRGLALLQCFNDGQRFLGRIELSRLTGIPRPSVTRLAATLVANRWLQPEPGGKRYMLGAAVVSLAQVFLSGLDVRAAARGPMQALAERTGGSVYLAVRDGLEMVRRGLCVFRRPAAPADRPAIVGAGAGGGQRYRRPGCRARRCLIACPPCPSAAKTHAIDWRRKSHARWP